MGLHLSRNATVVAKSHCHWGWSGQWMAPTVELGASSPPNSNSSWCGSRASWTRMQPTHSWQQRRLVVAWCPPAYEGAGSPIGSARTSNSSSAAVVAARLHSTAVDPQSVRCRRTTTRQLDDCQEELGPASQRYLSIDSSAHVDRQHICHRWCSFFANTKLFINTVQGGPKK